MLMRKLWWLWLIPLLASCQNFRPLPNGMAFEGPARPAHSVQFFADATWMDADGNRQVEQQIFDEILRRIGTAEELIVLDMFLFNDFLGKDDKALRPLSSELTQALIKQKHQHPDMRVVLISDPVNTVYGGLPSDQFESMRAAGIDVVLTDLENLHDSNALYSFVWRLLFKPFGNNTADTLPNPFGPGRVSLRSYLRLLNFKANHRKTMINDSPAGWQALVTSANPHDGSAAHRNVALGFGGAAVADLLATENMVLKWSGIDPLVIETGSPDEQVASSLSLRVLTESAIERAALAMLDAAHRGDDVDLLMFYLADRHLIAALGHAAERGANVRVLLDPNKDAFGLEKNGIPNRPVAAELVGEGIDVRWCDTHGEQCHGKMLMLRQPERSALLLGSANFTRRNLHDFNLETDVLLDGDGQAKAFHDAEQHFERMWGNRDGRFSSEYRHYADESIWKAPLYRFQECSGMSTF